MSMTCTVMSHAALLKQHEPKADAGLELQLTSQLPQIAPHSDCQATWRLLSARGCAHATAAGLWQAELAAQLS